MNKIFKVIWSKTRNCYVVASELAKGHTKASSTGDKTRRLALAAITALMLLPVGGFSYAADTTTVTDTDNTSQTVYTKEGTDKQVSDAKTYTYRKVAAEETAREEADTKLDNRITDVKEYLEKQTSDTYVSKDDAAVQDGAIVKENNTIGDNVTKLDAALAKETAARIGADVAQDKVIQKVNDNLVASVNTINESVETTNKNMAAGFTALSQADANEAAARAAADAVEKEARIGADTTLAAAVNSGLSLSDDNVLQKNTTTIDEQGNVTTSKTAASEMILNQGSDNQITLNKNGIKVGTNSTVMDANGVYTGGDTYDAAKAALKSDGSIKGANGAFTVDEKGNVTSKATITGETVTDGKGASMSNGTVTGKTLTDGIATITNGNINTSGSITGGTVTSTGNISALGDIHAGGAITGASASIQGALTAGSATITGDLTAGGDIQGKSISDGTATMQNGNITGVKNLSAETITTSGDATIGGDLTVNGKLNVDEIDLTKNGIVGDNNVTASTKVASGEITSYKKAISTKDGSEKESAIDYDENGTSTWAKSTDADGNWNKSTLTVEGSDVTSKVVDSDKNSNLSTQTSTESSSVLSSTEGKTSTFQQRVDEILNQINSSDTAFSKVDQKTDTITSEVTDGTNTTSSTQTTKDITNTATNGTISNNAKELTNTASDSITNTAENGNISNIASNGTISNEAKAISNKATEAMTNDAKTITNTASESVTTQIGDGSAVKSVMNDAGIANTATGKAITNDAATITNTGTTSVTNQVDNNKVLVDTTHVQSVFGDTIYTTWDENGITNNATNKTVATNAKDILNTATGNMTNNVGGNLTNTITGTSTTTVTGKVTEDYKSDLETKVGGNETHYVAGSQTNTVSGDRTVNVKGTEKENFNAQVTNVKTDQITSVGGNQTNIVTGDQKNTVSGNKTETVKGSVTEKYSSQATTVDGDQSTHVGGSQENVVTGNQTNTISGSKTESVKGAVTETYGSQSTTVNGDQSNTVKGKLTETVTGDVTEDYKANLSTTVGGNQTTTVTGDSSLSAKNITNTAKERLSNSATDIENKASNSILNQVGDNTSWKMTDGNLVETIKGADGQTNTTTTTADDTYQSVQNGNNVLAKRTSSTNDNLNITDGTNTYNKITTATSNKQTVTYGTETASTNLTKSASNTYITNGTQTVTNHIAADTTNTVMNEGSNGSRREQTASQILDRVTDGTNTNSTTTTASGTTFENTAHNTALTEMTKHESGNFTNTTISGNTLTTGQATMDYAEVMKDLGVHGNATVDQNLTVEGTTTTDKLVVNNGATVTGGTTTDTLHVTSTSTFDGAATFKDVVTMEKDLSVGGNATVAGSMTASSYKVGDKTYIDANGINANNQKITNVAAGDLSASSTDAVNGAQLYQTNERVTGVENRVDTVENRVNKLDSRVDKVGANAAALANLHPLEFDADSKWNIAAAVGGYKGETATAIGAFYRPNENVMVNVSSSFGTGENMYGGGISLRIGQGGNKARRNATNGLTDREKAMQKQIDSLTNRLDALLSVINPNMSKAFPDVPENHWAYEAVSKLAGNGIVQGYEDGKYHGERTMTRYEMAEIIYNALSKGAKAEKKLIEEFKPELQAMAAQKQA